MSSNDLIIQLNVWNPIALTKIVTLKLNDGNKIRDIA